MYPEKSYCPMLYKNIGHHNKKPYRIALYNPVDNKYKHVEAFLNITFVNYQNY